ncbi:hypothetical protein IMCC12053_2065 [Celeribacter marinus]|uniref:Uncharacterized protein n=1 Tax=Celeribacter marinus TaxID=1397108 RepID=A0A0N9ZK09_9RHOB|nr:hypothetical protein IMCC12053_2065 [Celeribacter marinus]
MNGSPHLGGPFFLGAVTEKNANVTCRDKADTLHAAQSVA